MGLVAWYMDDDTTASQKLPHHKSPPEFVDQSILDDLGVLSWELSGTDDDPTLQQICKDRGYTYKDMIHCCPDKLPAYDAKIKAFYEEHIHYDEEIRYCMDGTGYFDVRDKEDRWIRIQMGKGNLIILPEGIYHRYTNDSNDYIKVMRLFVGEPVWTPYNRDIINEENLSRKKYVDNFIKKVDKITTVTEVHELEGEDDEVTNKRKRDQEDAIIATNK
jgi:1,2-dihydroxy-3-keto-5-methylthiopentene dioxygenase